MPFCILELLLEKLVNSDLNRKWKNLSTETSYWAVTSLLHRLPCAVFRQRFSCQLTEKCSDDKKPTTSGWVLRRILQLDNTEHRNPQLSSLLTLSFLLSETPVEIVLLKITTSICRTVTARGETECWEGGKVLIHDGYQGLDAQSLKVFKARQGFWAVWFSRSCPCSWQRGWK